MDRDPFSPESLGRTVCDAFDQFVRDRKGGNAWAALVRRLHEQLVAPDPALGLRGLLWVLTHRSEYVYQNLAGELLNLEELPCTQPLDELLDALLPSFNASSNETVRYLISAFSKEALLAAVQQRLAQPTPDHRPALETFLYWLGAER